MQLSSRGLVYALLATMCIAALLPFAAHAQTTPSADLRAAIYAALVQDPRSADMADADFEALVDALAEQAVAEGITAHDIQWRPAEPEVLAVPEACAMPAFLCTMSDAFGFDGSDIAIPIGLGIASALLLFVIGMFLHRLGRHPVAGALR